MPHPDYRIQAHVCVASPGPNQAPTTGDGPRGKFHSKSQTTLRFAVEDVRAWAARFRDGEESGHCDVVDHHVILESATADEFREAIADAVDRLDFHFEDSLGGSLNVSFSGHGSIDGDLVMADRLVSPDELMEWCAGGRAGDNGRTRNLRTVIDSCYSGLTLCRMLFHPHHWTRVVVRDGYAACLPSEEAFEMRSLRRSVLTYTMLRPGWELWSKGPEELSAEEVREVKTSIRETTQYLTNGEQHALEVINGHAISVRGCGASVEACDTTTLDELVEAVDLLPTRRRKTW